MSLTAVVRGCGAYLPENVLTNEDLSKTVDTSDAWIRERTGIRERHIAADGEYTSDLAAHAARAALQSAGMDASDIDLTDANISHETMEQIYAEELQAA